jgi:hypothetical protein
LKTMPTSSDEIDKPPRPSVNPAGKSRIPSAACDH